MRGSSRLELGSAIRVLVAATLVSLSPVPADAVPRERFIVVLQDHVPSDAVADTARHIVAGARGMLPSVEIVRYESTPGSASHADKKDVVFHRALKGFALRLGSDSAGNLASLTNHPDVAYVVPDRTAELHAQMFQPGMERIRVRDHALTAIDGIHNAGVDADIAILDTGIDAGHPDLNVFRSVSFVAGDPTSIDGHGHGTFVAGLAAAVDDDAGIHGVAPGARLWAVKIADANGLIYLSDLLSGLDYAAAHADLIDVVNISLGFTGLPDDGNCGATGNDPLHQAICALVDAGVVVVASAGNSAPYGRDASLISPAAYDEVIAVSAVVETDGLGPGAGQGLPTIHGADNSFAGTFSNYGWDVDLAAPGVDVISTWPGGGYESGSGTSAAAPHVAGAAALWIATYGKPIDRQQVLHVRDELVRLGFPQVGADEGFSGDKDIFREPLLNVGALDPAVFAPVDPRLDTDKPVYELGQDILAVVSVQVRDDRGAPLDGLPGNAFVAYLDGQLQETAFEALGQGQYALTVDISGLYPGDYDFTAVIRNVAGFQRSAGCRIRIHDVSPGIVIREFAFAWPRMGPDWFSDTNPLWATLSDETGAPLVIPTDALQTTFSADGSTLSWSLPTPDYVSGVHRGITYGTYVTEIAGVSSLPLGTHYADLVVAHAGRSAQSSASFELTTADPWLTAGLSASVSTLDFTQSVPPPPLDLHARVENEWSVGVGGLLYMLTDPIIVEADGQVVAGVSFVEEPFGSGDYVARDVPTASLAHGSRRLVVRATDSRGLHAESNPVVVQVVRETGPCADPLAAAGQADADGDGVRDECDNCPTVSNRSQRDTPSAHAGDAGLGDACRALPRVWVSSDPDDAADFSAIQQAVDEAMPGSGVVRIEILPGNGPYLESIVVDRGVSFDFSGPGDGAATAVLESGTSGNGIFDLRNAGEEPIVIRNLVLRGPGANVDQRGVAAGPGVSTRLSDLRFEQLAYGLDLGDGEHKVQRITVDGTSGTGVLLDGGALALHYAEVLGSGQAIRMLGDGARAAVDHLLAVGDGNGDAIVNDATLTGSLALRHSTLVNWSTAVRGIAGNTTVAHCVLWNNQAAFDGVDCREVAWSDVQGVTCGETNLSIDPSFVDPVAGNYRLRADSPLLDHGPDPVQFDGLPCTDLDGGPRLRDHLGDGAARTDPGAYERENPSLVPPEVSGLAWSDPETLVWQAVSGAREYHVYRGTLSALAYADFGSCRDELDAVRDDTTLTDATSAPPGDGFFYVITVSDTTGTESTLGVGACAERSNFDSCP